MNPKLEPYLVPISIAVAGLIIAGSVFLSVRNTPINPGGQKQQGEAPPEPNPTDKLGATIETIIPIDGDPVLGSPSAKVTMIEFSDFQCPFCKMYSLDTFPKIKSQYVDAGQVKIVFKNFPVPGHSYAVVAAEAGECAFEQNKFWEYKEKLFENQANLDAENLKRYAQDLGLNAAKFNSCLDSKKYQSRVEGDARNGQEAGIRGTPSFVINGTLIPGAYPFSDFEKIIEEKLKQQ
ncbi:MAG: DsbA family protein [Candidatus Nealsonbacteria bacterium]|nr:DsbA family protein [Candidatus Nealsonbacteria bacterium]